VKSLCVSERLGQKAADYTVRQNNLPMDAPTQVWTSVDSQADLDRLQASVCWEDSETIEFYGLSRNERYFPSDVSRSGWHHPNIHLFCRVDSPLGSFAHIVLIACDWFYPTWVNSPYFRGRVDTLRRIEVYDGHQSTQMRCSRVIYRFSWDDEPFNPPYLASLFVEPTP
jgi:hypothetical protein